MTPDRTRLVAALMLLSLVPVGAFVADRAVTYVALAAVCVLLVTASLYLLFGPADEPTAAGHN